MDKVSTSHDFVEEPECGVDSSDDCGAGPETEQGREPGLTQLRAEPAADAIPCEQRADPSAALRRRGGAKQEREDESAREEHRTNADQPQLKHFAEVFHGRKLVG